MSNKLINGNGREVIFIEFALDWVKKQGYEVIKTNKMLFISLIMVIVSFGIVNAQNFDFDDPELPTLNPRDNITIIQNITIVGNGGTGGNVSRWTNDSINVFLKPHFPQLVKIFRLGLGGAEASNYLTILNNQTEAISIAGTNNQTTNTVFSMSGSYVGFPTISDITMMQWAPSILDTTGNITEWKDLDFRFSTIIPLPYENTIDDYTNIHLNSRFLDGQFNEIKGIHINPIFSSASIGNFTGILIEDLTEGTENNIAIKTGLGDVQLGDTVNITGNTYSDGNITLSRPNRLMLHDQAGSSGDSYVWSPSTNSLEFVSSIMNFEAGTITFGTGDTSVSIGMDISSQDGEIALNNVSNPAFYQFTPNRLDYLTWYGSLLPAVFNNNLSWNNNVLADRFFINVPEVFFKGRINVTGDYYYRETNITPLFYNQTIEKPYGSLTTTSDSTTSTAEYNIYNESNYASYTYVNNSNWTNINYFSDTGRFEIQTDGIYYFSNTWVAEISSSSFADFIIKVNDNDVYNHNFRINQAIDPMTYTISQSRHLSKNDNITVHIDATANNIIIHDGSSFTIHKL